MNDSKSSGPTYPIRSNYNTFNDNIVNISWCGCILPNNNGDLMHVWSAATNPFIVAFTALSELEQVSKTCRPIEIGRTERSDVCITYCVRGKLFTHRFSRVGRGPRSLCSARIPKRPTAVCLWSESGRSVRPNAAATVRSTPPRGLSNFVVPDTRATRALRVITARTTKSEVKRARYSEKISPGINKTSIINYYYYYIIILYVQPLCFLDTQMIPRYAAVQCCVPFSIFLYRDGFPARLTFPL